MAEHFAAAVESVAGKVGSAIERAFEPGPDGSKAQRTAEGVGSQVASAIEQAIGKVGDAIPPPDPHRQHRKLLARRDRTNSRMVLFAMIALGVSGAILSADTGGGPAVFIIAAVFAALIFRDVMWKRSRRGAIARAQAALSGEEEVAEPPRAAETPDDVDPAAVEPPVTDDPQLRAIENEAQQVLELLGATGGSRDSIRDSVDATVAKARELTARRARLERMLADPDLADLDERIGDLERRIDETGDEETAEVYRRTLDQLCSQVAAWPTCG